MATTQRKPVSSQELFEGINRDRRIRRIGAWSLPSDELLQGLKDRLGADDARNVQVIEDATAPQRWSVWLYDDILGAGPTRFDALKDAIGSVIASER